MSNRRKFGEVVGENNEYLLPNLMNVMEVFYRVFSNQVRPLQLLRNIALGFADRFSPARYRVMRYAMGLEGRLPKLAKGQSIIDR